MGIIYRVKKIKKKINKKRIDGFMVGKFDTIVTNFVNMDPFHIKVS